MRLKERLNNGQLISLSELNELYPSASPEKNSAFENQDIHLALCHINGIDPETKNPTFVIDRKMWQRLAAHNWSADDRDNMHQNDAGKWVLSPFYERVVLYLSLHPFASLEPAQQLAASAMLAHYLQTLPDELQKKLVDYICSNPHMIQGVEAACRESVVLNSAMGLVILKYKEMSHTKSVIKLQDKICENLDVDDFKNIKKVLFVIRAIYQEQLNQWKNASSSNHAMRLGLEKIYISYPPFANLIKKMTGIEQSPGNPDVLLKKLFVALGYSSEELEAALLCYRENYKRILGKLVNDGQPDLQTMLTYFFLGESLDAAPRENVPGSNGLVFVIQSNSLTSALACGDMDRVEVLLAAGAYDKNMSGSDMLKSKLQDSTTRILRDKNAQLQAIVLQETYITESDVVEIENLLDQGAKADSVSLVNIFERKYYSRCQLSLKKEHDFNFLDKLITGGANNNSDKQAAAMRAAREGFVNAVGILLQAGIKVNERINNRTLLIEAAFGGDTKIAQMLVAAGAEIDATASGIRYCDSYSGWSGFDYSHWTYDCSVAPIHIASLHNNLSMVRFLLEKGANVNIVAQGWKDAPERTALELMQSHDHRKKDGQAIINLLTLWIEIDKTLTQAKGSATGGCVTKILEQFIKHHTSTFSFKTSNLPAAVTKAKMLRTLMTNNQKISSADEQQQLEGLLDILSRFIPEYLMAGHIDEDEANLAAICNRMVDHFNSQLQALNKKNSKVIATGEGDSAKVITTADGSIELKSLNKK